MHTDDKITRAIEGLLDGVDDGEASYRFDPGQTVQVQRTISHLERLVEPCRLDVGRRNPGISEQAVDKVVMTSVGVRVWALRSTQQGKPGHHPLGGCVLVPSRWTHIMTVGGLVGQCDGVAGFAQQHPLLPTAFKVGVIP